MARESDNLIDLEKIKSREEKQKIDRFKFFEKVKKHYPIEDFYNIGLQLFKEKEDLIVREVNHDTLNLLLSYIKQVSEVSFNGVVESNEVKNQEERDENCVKPMGISKDEAMLSFLDLFSKHYPAFIKHFLLKTQEFSIINEITQDNVKMCPNSRKQDIKEKRKLRQESIRKEMKEHLDRQTIGHFRQYVKQQCPDKPQEQELMIQELQGQHFEQYYEEVYLPQVVHQRQQFYQLQLLAQPTEEDPLTNEQAILSNDENPIHTHQIHTTPDDTQAINHFDNHYSTNINDHVTNAKTNHFKLNPLNSHKNIKDSSENNSINEILLNNKMNLRDDVKIINEKQQSGHHDNHKQEETSEYSEEEYDDDDEEDDDEEYDDEISERMPVLVPACMWTDVEDMEVFKNAYRNSPENILKVASLSTATIKIPTHEDSAVISWTFATDHFDIGFGVFFEWNVNPPDQVLVQVNDSSDDEEGEDEEGDDGREDVEKGNTTLKRHGPPMDEIIQIIRRDSHEELQCGSHCFPGRGVYHFKFDNSFSLWRSKTIYYKISYSK